MPLKRQTAAAEMHAEDVGLAYQPPPSAYDGATTRVATPTVTPQNDRRQNEPGAWEQLRARASQAAANQAARAQQRAEARAARAAQSARPSETSARTSEAQSVAHTPVVSRPVVLAPGVGWRQQMYVYTILLLIGYTIWVADGAFTVVGAVTTVLPMTMIGIAAAIAGHLFLSWGQHSLIFHPHLVIKGVGILLLCVNAASNVAGIPRAVRAIRPDLLGSLPADPRDWLSGLSTWGISLVRRVVDPDLPGLSAPKWAATAIIVLLAATLLAWFAEKIRDYFQAQWNAQWAIRPR